MREVYRISLKDASSEQDVLAHALSNIAGSIPSTQAWMHFVMASS